MAKVAGKQQPHAPEQIQHKPILHIGDIVNGRYLVTNVLGQGGFGAVFKVFEARKQEAYAMKVELQQPPSDEPGLRLEIGVMKRMQSQAHFIRYIDSGQFGMRNEHSFVVMQLVGQNLGNLRKQTPDLHFSLSTTLRLCLQSLDAIQSFHEAGLLHRDIKPGNFAMGSTPNDSRTVYLLDFGLVRRYRLKNGKMRKPRPKAGFRGTPKYASVNVHNNKDQGRHDDLWSWMFMMIEFLRGELPWRMEADRKKLGEMKVSTKDEFLRTMPHEISKMYDLITKLNYFDEPPYSNYRKTLKYLVKKHSIASHDPFDWEEKAASQKSTKSERKHHRKKEVEHKERAVKRREERDKNDTDTSDTDVSTTEG